MIHRADLHMHGPIGFEPFWLQQQGYAGKNLLKLIADECFKKGLTICAITSHHEDIIPRSSRDRFYCLKEIEAPRLPTEYETNALGETVLSVKKDGKTIYLINGQTAMARENNHKYDLLIVGTNRIPNDLSVQETAKRAHDLGFLVIAEHIGTRGHRGLGPNNFADYAHNFDAIEHNAQLALPSWLRFKPFSDYTKYQNQIAREIASRTDMKLVGNSDAHRIESAGRAFTEWEDTSALTESKIIQVIREKVISKDSIVFPGHEPLASWQKWVRLFRSHAEEDFPTTYIPCQALPTIPTKNK